MLVGGVRKCTWKIRDALIDFRKGNGSDAIVGSDYEDNVTKFRG